MISLDGNINLSESDKNRSMISIDIKGIIINDNDICYNRMLMNVNES